MIQDVQVLCVDRDERVETGSVVFKYKSGREDWNGLFVRGDNAFRLAMSIDSVLGSLTEEQRTANFIAVADLKSLVKLIRGDVIL